jgi:hypothetical protein
MLSVIAFSPVTYGGFYGHLLVLAICGVLKVAAMGAVIITASFLRGKQKAPANSSLIIKSPIPDDLKNPAILKRP